MDAPIEAPKLRCPCRWIPQGEDRRLGEWRGKPLALDAVGVVEVGVDAAVDGEELLVAGAGRRRSLRSFYIG